MNLNLNSNITGALNVITFNVFIVQQCVNNANKSEISIRINGIDPGDNIDWEVSDGVNMVTGNVIASADFEIISNVDLTSLNNGVLTVSGTNNTSSDVSTSTKNKDTVSPSGYAVDLLNQNTSFSQISALARLNFTGLEIGSVVSWRVTDNVLNVTGSFTASGTTATVENVDVSSLADGSIRALTTLTDACGNAGSEVASSVKTKDTIAPSGYDVKWIDSNINNQNETATDIEFELLEVGATAFVIITSDAGGTPITDDFVVANATENNTYDVSSLPNGTLTVSLVLVDIAGNVGAPVTDTIEKQVFTPSGYSIGWDEASYDETTGLAASATVTGANMGNTYYFEITSSGGGTPITGSGTVALSSFQIIEDITSLSSGTGTIEYYEEDPNGNVGGDVSDTATFDLTVPLLLDLYPAGLAVGVVRLKSSATLAIRVRRSPDNAEQDIGFVNNIIDTASLLAFVGSGNGFVTTIYDQSGNNNNYTQTLDTRQGIIVINGVLQVDENGLPIIVKNDANTGYLSDYNPNGTERQVMYVGRRTASGFSCVFGLDTSASEYVNYLVPGSPATAVNAGLLNLNERLNGSVITSPATRGDAFNLWAIRQLRVFNCDWSMTRPNVALGYRFSNPSNSGMIETQCVVFFETQSFTTEKEILINNQLNVF